MGNQAAKMLGQTPQVVVFAGGMGKRIGTRIPKPLVQINGRTLLQICVNSFTSSGFNDFVFLLGYKADLVLRHIRKICERFSYSIDPRPDYGRLNSIKYAISNGKIDQKRTIFVSYPDDILLGDNILMRIYKKHLEAVTKKKVLASVVLSDSIKLQFGVAKLDSNNLVREFIEKPTLPVNVSVGAYLLESGAIRILQETEGKEIETAFFPRIANEGKLNSIIIPFESWIPVNTRKDVENAEAVLAIKR